MKKRVLVAMSGGVDSAVAAFLLREQGHDVAGATIQTWAPKDCDNLNTRACCSVEGVEDARSVANRLDISYYVFNMEKEFRENVVEYFLDEYEKGRTPNPCIKCNETVKLRQFYKRAQVMGYDYIATGHYARVVHDQKAGVSQIVEGLDGTKDQAYVLFSQQQDVLQRLLLPCGEYQKSKIREIAREIGLTVHDKPDSQEICFIPSNDYASFYRKQRDIKDMPGSIINQAGEILGQHPGYFHFTIGQRKGLGIAWKEPLYVLEIRKESNEVVVGTKEEVRQSSFLVSDLNWTQPLATAGETLQVKIRAHHEKAEAFVCIENENEVRVTFCEPQDAITPGQAAVFYTGDGVRGGGWIRSVIG